MAWNEPGGSKDPWGGSNQQGPPDLEEALKNLQNKLAGIFGGKPGGGGGRGAGGGMGQLGSKGLWLIAVVVVGIWILSGAYTVDQAEEAVVTRFGKYDRTEPPGFHWLPTLIERAELVNVRQARTAEVGFRSAGRTQGSVPHESLMLTQDENIVDLKFAVQYRVKSAKDYLFNDIAPDITLRQATESAVREVVGKNKMDFVITGGREVVADAAETLIQEILDRYRTGLLVTSVNMQDAQPPAQVQEAFADAVKAREDEERFKNEAEAYANDILPKARGDADARRAQAEGYEQRVVALAQGESSRFTAILKEYKKAPAVTRERMYLDTIESVLGQTSKVLLDVEGSNNLLYLPLDQLLSGAASAPQGGARGLSPSLRPSTPQQGGTSRRQGDSFRGRSR